MIFSPTKEKIKQTIIELINTTDIDKISTTELVKKANISRATFYRHYDSIEHVITEMEEDFLEGMRDVSRYYISARFDLNMLDKPYPEFIAVAEYTKLHKEFFLAITGPHGDGRFLARWNKFLKEFYYGKLAYNGLTNEHIDIYAEAILSGSNALTRYWLAKRSDVSVEAIVVITQKILYGPFVT